MWHYELAQAELETSNFERGQEAQSVIALYKNPCGRLRRIFQEIIMAVLSESSG